MNLHSIVKTAGACAIALAIATTGAAPALAQGWNHYHGGGWYPDRHWHAGWFLHADGFYYPYAVAVPAPVYVAPAPVYVAPAPVYVAPAPVYMAPPGISFGVNIR